MVAPAAPDMTAMIVGEVATNAVDEIRQRLGGITHARFRGDAALACAQTIALSILLSEVDRADWAQAVLNLNRDLINTTQTLEEIQAIIRRERLLASMPPASRA